MTDFTSTPDAEAEASIFARLRNIDKAERLNYASKGLMAREVRDRLLWKLRDDPETGLPCRSWTRWVRIACPYGYSGVHAALEDVEALKDVPDADLAGIPPSNFPTMRKLSTAVRAETEILTAAKTLRNEDFVEAVRKSHPDQAIEHTKLMRFHPSESAAKVITETLEMAMERGAGTRDDALEAICAEVRQVWRMEEQVEEAHAETSQGS